MGDTEKVWEAIRDRRVIRAFTDEPLRPEHLERILAAGRRASSSKNQQHWAFIVCRDRDHLKELSKVGPYAGHIAGAAVAIALVTPVAKTEHASHTLMFDLGQAAGSMMLAAWEIGVGSVPATVYDLDVARRLLGLPADQVCAFFLSFGYPADPTDITRPPRAGGRRPIDELVHEERW